jgi:hypothetical protein
MRLEVHDSEVDNKGKGTLVASLKNPVDYPYQIEMHVIELLQDVETARRFYVFDGMSVFAVYGREDRGKVYYIGRAPEWRGEWELPFLYPSASSIVTTTLGQEVKDMEEAALWAAKSLCGVVATAIVIDEHGIVAAWEAGPQNAVLRATTPRPLPRPNAT